MARKTFTPKIRSKSRSGRNIRTVYYYGNEVVKCNRAKYANTAVLACVKHMQFNTYEATHAEVFDDDDGVVHAIVKAKLVDGKHEIHILYRRAVQLEE